MKEHVDTHFFKLFKKDWILQIEQSGWDSHDQWTLNGHRENLLSKFTKTSSRMYSLMGGISDAFAFEGGICMGATAIGMEEILVEAIGKLYDNRVDYRGRYYYYTHSRDRIGTNHMGRLSYALKLAGVRHTLKDT